MEKGNAEPGKIKRMASYRRRVGGGIVDMSRGGRATFTCHVCGVGFEGYKSALPKYCSKHVAEYRLRSGRRLHAEYMEKMRDPAYREAATQRFKDNTKPWQEKRAFIHRARMLAAVDLYGVGFLVKEIADIIGLDKGNVSEMLTEAGLGNLGGKDGNRQRRRRGELLPPPGV
jgi:hypothetical protein